MEVAFLTWGVAWTVAGRVRRAALLLFLIPTIAAGISALDISFRVALGVVPLTHAGGHFAFFFAWSLLAGVIAAALVRLRHWRTVRYEREATTNRSTARHFHEPTVRRTRR